MADNDGKEIKMRTSFFIVAPFLLLSPLAASAQSLLLQSPVFSQFSVQTNVSVPDRGGMLLGSVSRAADGTKSFGPIPAGSSRGRSIEHRSMSSRVYIIDFNELDPFLREQRRRNAVAIDPIREKQGRERRAAAAYRKLAAKAEKNRRYDLAMKYRKRAVEYDAKVALHRQTTEKP